jgi:hypothetical protein
MKILNGWEAQKIDCGSVFADYDDENGIWGVFGTETGFCYSTHGSEKDAEVVATQHQQSASREG